MLRKQKRQLRYAADQIISNPRRDTEDESHLDLVHLKRRGVLDSDSSTKNQDSKNQIDSAELADENGIDAQNDATEIKDSQIDETSIEFDDFDEVDELLLDDIDDELETVIQQRLKTSTERVRRPSPIKSASDPDLSFAEQPLTQTIARSGRSYEDSDDVIDLNERAKSDRAKIRFETEHDRREAELARQQRDRYQQQIQNDRLEILEAQKEQAAILERAEKEREKLQEAIESVREKARQAEVERAEIIQTMDKDRQELSRKLDDERKFAQQAEQEREDLRKVTEQHQSAVRDALASQQEEAKRLSSEARKLENEARQLEYDRVDIQKKAFKERLAVQKVLEKEREQVRHVSEQWLEIQNRARAEREKIQSLVDSQDNGQSTPDVPRPAEQPSSKTATVPGGQRTSSRHESDSLASLDKRDRELRELILREQAAFNPASSQPSQPPSTPQNELDPNEPGLKRTGTPSDSADSEQPQTRMSPPTPNRFSDSSGATAKESDPRPSDSSIKSLRESEDVTARSTKKQEPQLPQPAEEPQPAKEQKPGKRIPVLESSERTAMTIRSSSRRRSGFGGMKFLAATMAVFFVVVLGSSIAFFGFLNLGVAEFDPDAQVSDTEPGVIDRVTQVLSKYRNRYFPADDESSQAQAESTAENRNVDGDKKDIAAVENAPAAVETAGQSAAREPTETVSGDAATPAADVLRGRVVTESNTPVAGVSITALARKFFTDPKGSSGGVNYRTRSDAQGNFTLRLPPGEEYRVVTDGTQQYAPASVNMSPGKAPAEIVLSDLNGALSVTGRIFTDSLDPISDAKAMTQFEPAQEVFSDVDGVYAIQVSPPTSGSDDTLVLRFEAAGFQDGIMHLPANVWKAGKAISHDVFLDPL